jgi:integration host factor subunit beta
MKKSELIEALAQDQGLPTKTAASIVNTILDTMIETLVRGDNIEVRGFGSFTVREYETYTGRNPKTGAQVSVKPKRLPVFKVGKDLRKSLNSNRRN